MSMPETIYTLDVLFGAFVVMFGVAGLLRGLAGELARLITLLVFLTGVCFFYPALLGLATYQWRTLPPAAVQTVTTVVVVLSSVLVYALLRVIFQQVFKEQVGKFFDRMFGAMVGMVFGLLVGLSVLCAVSLMPQDRPYRILSENSAIGSWVCVRLTPWLYPRLMEMPVFDQEEEVPAE
jgi:uncharacterized membrane protein required for colicin V production